MFQVAGPAIRRIPHESLKISCKDLSAREVDASGEASNAGRPRLPG
jgi:hypothetical protein